MPITDLLSKIPALLGSPVAWADGHPSVAGLVIALAMYAAWNIAKRPPPANPVLYRLWQLCELAAVLPWDRWLGRWSPPFRIDPPLPEADAPRSPAVTIDEAKRVPAPAPSDEVTWPKGPPTPRNDNRGPRGFATIRTLVAILIAASICALPLAAGCGAQPLVVHVVDRADGVCPEVVIVLPEIGPVCTLLRTVDRLLELLAAAQAEGVGLTVSVDGHRVTIPPAKIEEVRAGVAGARASVRRSAPVSTGSAR